MSDEKNIFNPKLLPNDRLCEIIVVQRYLGIMQTEAIASMEELTNRRLAGDNFEYEKKIEEILSGLPNFNLDLKKILTNPIELSKLSGLLK